MILLSFLLTAGLYVSAQVDYRLVAHLPFDGGVTSFGPRGAVDTTADITGNGHFGKVNGAQKIPDRFGKANCAYEFDGMSFISVNDPDSLFLNNYTVSYWVKPYQVTPSGQYHYTISMGGFGGDNSMSINNNGYYGFVAGAYNLTAPISIASNAVQIVPNRWYFVAFSRSDNKLSLYIDGQLAAQDDIDNGSAPNYGVGQRNVTMGVRCSFNSESYLTGALDDVRFYNSALESTEIASLYTLNSVENEIEVNFNLYPNPSFGTLYLRNESKTIKFYKYTIVDLQGRIVQTGSLDGNVIPLEEQISQGTYLVRLDNTNGGATVNKIVLIR